MSGLKPGPISEARALRSKGSQKQGLSEARALRSKGSQKQGLSEARAKTKAKFRVTALFGS
jgi:hypothetical protein